MTAASPLLSPPPSKRAQEIFADALERAEAFRAGFVAAACGDDAGLRTEVEGLLGAHSLAGDSFLESDSASRAELLENGLPSGAPEEPPPELLPSRIGRYAVLRRIGAGGMGAVYEAVQERPRRTVALKVMSSGLASRTATRRFELESELLGRLRHPAIAQVYEAGQFDDGISPVPFFAMEYIPDARPITRFAQDQALSIRDRLALFATVCDAVHHGHTRGIIHRDLKPSNILVDQAGRPKVIDFGVARATDADLAATTMATQASALIGTLQYMSPEQAAAAGPEHLDSRSDVYSLGIVVYELVCGKLPYDLSGQSIADATRHIREDAPCPPGSIDRTLRGDLSTIILKALQKDPERRYQSAAELKADVERFLAGQPIAARRDSVVYIARTRSRTWIAKHSIIAAIIAVLAAWTLSSAAGYSVGRWTGTSLRMERWSGASHDPTRPPSLNPVRLVSVADSSLQPLADRYGFSLAALSEERGLRGIYGRLATRLATAAPSAVVFDLSFRGDAPGDVEFISGLESLRRANIPVVATTVDGVWSLGAQGARDYNTEILGHLRLAGATTMESSPTFLTVDVGIAHSLTDVVPGLALAALAATRHPEATPTYALIPFDDMVEVAYWRNPGSGTMQRADAPMRFRVSSISEEPLNDPDNCILQGDFTASLIVQLPLPSDLARITSPIEDLLAAPDADFSAAVRGRVVVVGDRSANQFDFLDGTSRTLHGSLAHAVAIASLLGVDRLRMASDLASNLIAFAIAIGGVLVPLLLPRGLWWRSMAALAGLSLSVASCLALFRFTGQILYPAYPVLAFLAALALSILIERARRARRLA